MKVPTLALTLVLAALLGGTLPAADNGGKPYAVTLADGKVQHFDKVAFDGGQFILDGVRVPAERVRRFEIDAAALERLRGRVSELQQRIAEQDSALDTYRKSQAEGGDRLSARLKLGGEIERLESELEALRREKADREARLAALELEAQSLKASNEELADASDKLRKQLDESRAAREALEAEREKLASQLERLERPDFRYELIDLSHQPPGPEGLVDVSGRLRNRSESVFDTVVVEVTALDTDGKVLAGNTTFFGNFSPGVERPFQTDLALDSEIEGKLKLEVHAWPLDGTPRPPESGD